MNWKQYKSAYAAKEFRSVGHAVIDQLADYLEQAEARDMSVLTPVSPEQLLADWDQGFSKTGDSSLLSLLQSVLTHSTHLHHPGYVGHQIAVPMPAATLLEMVNALLSNGMAVFEMGQLQTIMEHRVVEHLAEVVGFDRNSGGILTHGGTIGNLTALLAARQAGAGHDVWTEGQREPLSVLVSDQAHYCIARAAQLMGWGDQGAWRVKSDERYRMDPEALGDSLRAAQEAGRHVFAVVASCCSTATGSFDPIEEIADFCQEHGLWLHVDGAHGASLLLSPEHRHKLKGIERADSVVWDLHKMMCLPAMNTVLLFRDGRRSYEAFAQEAGYLFASESPEEQWFNLGTRTLECTKRGMGMTAYCMLQSLGTDWFAAHVDRLMEITSMLEGMLREAEDFELACEPEANIVCFRHLPGGELSVEEMNAHQAKLRRRVVEAGEYFLVQTRLEEELWLRTTLMNPLTEKEDLAGLLAALRGSAGSA
ncbi:MAG: pyridoxal phosphate-dependent decarboxylase family protein [Planctomycetota bacterium]|jgi:L-2,4-diaminobutyrate decarboxylase